MAIRITPRDIKPVITAAEANEALLGQKPESPMPQKVPEKKDGFGDIKGLIRKYFAKVPFIRGKDIAEILVDPDNAIPREIQTTGIKRGFLDSLMSMEVFFLAIGALCIFAIIALMLLSLVLGFSLDSLVSSASLTFIVIAILAAAALMLIALPIYVFLALLLQTTFFFFFSKMMGGKGSFSKMFGLIGTFGAAYNVVMMILIMLYFVCIGMCLATPVSLVMYFYGAYLIYKMNIYLHGLSESQAKTATVVPYVILFIVGIIMYLLPYILNIPGVE